MKVRIAICVLLVAGLAAITNAVATPTAGPSEFPRCRDSQITETAAQLPGAAVTGGWVIRYRNVSSSGCTLTGYPTVVALAGATGPSEVAAHSRSGALGGLLPAPSGMGAPLPRVLLRAGTTGASSVVQFASAATAQSTCPDKDLPLWFHYLWVNIPTGKRPFALSVSMIVCSHLTANPIVRGSTGSTGG